MVHLRHIEIKISRYKKCVAEKYVTKLPMNLRGQATVLMDDMAQQTEL